MFEGLDIFLRDLSKSSLPIDPSAFVFGLEYVVTYFGIGYLIGSIPFAVIFAKVFRVKHPHEIGSGNVGASNMYRAGGFKPAIATLIADAGKAAVAASYALDAGPDLLAATVLGALLGHLFPIWLKFKGGKGVAVFFGSILMVAPWFAIIAMSVWLIVFFVLRFSSVSSLIAVLIPPILMSYYFDESGARLFYWVALIIWLAHYSNIVRLIKRTENRYNFSSDENK